MKTNHELHLALQDERCRHLRKLYDLRYDLLRVMYSLDEAHKELEHRLKTSADETGQ